MISIDPLSLYIHIPFCSRKCAYCSFAVVAWWMHGISESLKDGYTDHLVKEIIHYAHEYACRPIYTVYLGWGTPTLLGPSRLIAIIDTVIDHYDCRNLAELTIECNPDQREYFFPTISQIQEKYPRIPCIRRSIWVQTWDEDILVDSGRGYDIAHLQECIQTLPWLKSDNTSYNIDLIAFGRLDQGLPWAQSERIYRSDLLHKQIIDHCSVYTLELFEWSLWYHQLTQTAQADQLRQKLGYGLKKYGSDDDVYQEFEYLSTALDDAWYHRYELSNFALDGRQSLHNQVYRQYGDYLGLGMSSSSKIGSYRRSNHKTLAWYLHKEWIDHQTKQTLTHQDQLIESFFLALRTSSGIASMEIYEQVLEDDYPNRLCEYRDGWYIHHDGVRWSLTPAGMNIYNHMITDLLCHL